MPPYQVVISHKKCEKKLREIQKLKLRVTPLTSEEQEKVNQETKYKKIIKNVYEKELERIPDEVQNVILSYLDPNTRLKLLKQKYSPKYLGEKLSSLPRTMKTMKLLYGMTQLVRDVLLQYLKKDGDIYKNVILYIWQKNQTFCTKQFGKYQDFYLDKMNYMIMAAIQNYTNMYTKTTNSMTHYEYEKLMVKLYANIILS